MYFISYINNAVIKFLVYNASHVRIAGIIVLSFSSDSMYLNRTMLHIYTYTNIFVMFLSIPTYQMSIVLDLQLPMQSVSITTKVVSSNPIHGEVYIKPLLKKSVTL